jgi:hypothetical protein
MEALQHALAEARKLFEKQVSREDLVDFLNQYPNPNDKTVHEWAQKNGFEVEKVEEALYQFAFLFNTILKKALKEEIFDLKVDPKELAKGIVIEKEHTSNEHVAEIIARMHLKEFPNYYLGKGGLVDMENNLKKGI